MVAKLNTKLASIHYYIEYAFGICKGRFRILNHPPEYTKEDVVRTSFLITEIFILHNFLIEERMIPSLNKLSLIQMMIGVKVEKPVKILIKWQIWQLGIFFYNI